eukprot:m.1207065 g.1207065  ORF g.1207065 m.1207065 type:complete len:74 (-) comp24586_c0_seq40:233-454(-)
MVEGAVENNASPLSARCAFGAVHRAHVPSASASAHDTLLQLEAYRVPVCCNSTTTRPSSPTVKFQSVLRGMSS